MSDPRPSEPDGPSGSSTTSADPFSDTQESPAPTKAPGWYHDDHATIRWWNGAEWDVGAPAPTTTASGFAPGAPGAHPGGYQAGYAPGYPPPPGNQPAQGGFQPTQSGYPPAYGYAAGGYPGGAPGPMYPPAGGGVGNARTMALLAHLGAFVGGFILPLIILLTSGKDDPFVRHHASESLNFQLTYLMLVLGGILISLLTLGFGLILFVPLFFVAVIVHIVCAIMAMMAANRGEWYRYPINIRMVKGAA